MAYNRIDHCDDLIHFTKGNDPQNYEQAFHKLMEIIKSGKLMATTYKRFKSVSSICFTEAPYQCLTKDSVLDKKYFKHYSPFGIMFSKTYIYRIGGLPVVYWRPNTIDLAQPELHWRIVTFDPVSDSELFRDYSWEREWRIKPQNGELILESTNAKIVLPSEYWVQRFRDEHDKEHHSQNCNCNCKRTATVITFERYFSKEEHTRLQGTCTDASLFPWTILNMNCQGVGPTCEVESK